MTIGMPRRIPTTEEDGDMREDTESADRIGDEVSRLFDLLVSVLFVSGVSCVRLDRPFGDPCWAAVVVVKTFPTYVHTIAKGTVVPL